VRYDVAVVGAGHNGLVAACYLAKAGCSVLVLERRNVVGGAVCTEEDLIPGYKIDVGSSLHIMIHLTPVVAELELEKFGLEYLDVDPWAFHPLPEGACGGFFFWKDLDKTCESIASVSQRDAEAYRRFVEVWGALNAGVFEAFLRPPSARNLMSVLTRRGFKGRSAEILRKLSLPYGRLIDDTFQHESVRAAMKWLAAQSGPDPDAPASANLAGWQAMIHRSGARRPRGGSGRLSQALAACLVSHGGEVLTGAEVSGIDAAETGCRVCLADGRAVTADRVLAACHVRTTFLKLLDPCPDSLRSRVAALRPGNGFGMIVRHAMSRLPRYPGFAENDLCHRGMQLLCPSSAYLRECHEAYKTGRTPERPAVIGMTFSAIDDTLAPPGKHVLFTWAQYHPYRLAGGQRWDDIARREADRILEVVEAHAPGTKAAVLDRFIQSPLDLERRLGLIGGNVMHLEMSLDRMFCMRPLPELSSYRTPVPNLYISGASCHPGGGVFGASGYNAAGAILEDLGITRPRDK
jgi:phytoene dehydrogenase-like protein